MSHCKNKESRLIKKWNIIHLYGDSCKYKKKNNPTRWPDCSFLNKLILNRIRLFLFFRFFRFGFLQSFGAYIITCLLYTSDAADEL